MMCYQLHNLSVLLPSLYLVYLLNLNNQRHNFFIKIKKCQFFCEVCNNKVISNWLKYNEMFYFLSVFGVELGVRNDRKWVSRMWKNAYLSIKNLGSSLAHLRALDPWLTWCCFIILAFSFEKNSLPPFPSWIRYWLVPALLCVPSNTLL